jgi:site-specific DNA-cytosine methylase
MYKCSEFILSRIRPKIFWGENSIYLCTDKGRPVADKLARIGQNCDYTFLIYATENRMHGNPQKRARTFYFYFRNDIFGKDTIPILNKLDVINKSVEELLMEVKSVKDDLMNIPINDANPADHPFYQYLFESMNAKDHRDLVMKISPELNNKVNALTIIGYTILNNQDKLIEIANWMKNHGFDKASDRILAIKKKLDDGKNAWMKGPMIARGFIPAFVGDLVECFIHPFECRYLTYREALSIMTMPSDFNMIGNIKSNRNHIAQNVCTSTSEIMSYEIAKMLNFQNQTIQVNNQYVVQDHRKGDKLEFRNI